MAAKKTGTGTAATPRKRATGKGGVKAAGAANTLTPHTVPQTPPCAPRTLRTVADLQAGDHLCCIYETEAEHRAVLTPYLRQGLERGEKVLYVVDAHTAETVLGYLRDDGLDPDPFVARGQFAILSRDETYLRGGAFYPAGMIALLRKETERALAEGYPALRVTGEMTWALRGRPGSERLIEYEILLNEFFPGSRCLALCQYDRRRFEPSVLLYVLRTHPYVVVGSEVCENPHYLPPADLLSADSSAAELRRWMRGLTEQRHAEEAWRESEERYRTLVESALDGIVIHVGDRVAFANRAAAAMLGFAGPAALVGQPLESFVHPEDLASAQDRVRRVLAGEAVAYPVEVRYVKQDGTALPVENTGVLVTYEGQPAILSVIRDITERKRAEEELRGSENRIQSIFRAAPTGIGVVRDRILLEVNTRICEMTGYAREELIGHSARIFYPTQEEFEQVGSEKYRQIAKKGTGSVETRWLSKDGSIMEILLSSTPIDPHDLSVGVTFTALDISERKRTEEALRLQSSALNAAANAVVITDRDGGIVWVNPAFLALTGYREDEVLGANPRLLKSGAQDQAFYQDLWDTILAGDVRHGELTDRRKDGTRYHAEMTITPLRDAHGEVRHFIAVKQDVTERKLLQSEFLQSQKMESVGRLAGGIAHDFNNLLSVINGYAELAAADRSLSNSQRAQVVAIHRAGERAATLTRQLLLFSRRQAAAPVVLDLNAAIRTDERMLERLLGEDISLIFAPTEPLGSVKADPGQIEQIVMNLAVNARDAMPEGGMLSIETADVELDREAAELASVQPGPYVMLAVSDSGVGMDEATSAHIFEPFFTTKGPGKGTGLGLAVVYGIVRQFGGGIRVASTPGQGTTFTLYLPQVEAAVREDATAAPAPAVGGTETILVVEDEESVRALATDVLASAGYTVLEARNGEEALQALERHDAPVDLVFTDMVMPGMGGTALAEELARTRPGLRVLFTSGYDSGSLARGAELDGVMHFIGKPYTVAGLTRKVREVLDWLW